MHILIQTIQMKSITVKLSANIKPQPQERRGKNCTASKDYLYSETTY